MSNSPEKVFSLRIPVSLYDRVAKIAEKELRSVNATILLMLMEGTRRHEKANREILEDDKIEEDIMALEGVPE